MTNKKNKYFANIAIPPGETLLETIEALDMSQVELADRMGMSRKTINEIIKGKAPITKETALKLESVLGAPASFWNNLESNYQENLARIKAEQALEEEIEIAKEIPYLEISKLNWVKLERDAKEKTKNLRNFFGVATLKQVPLVLSGAFRKADGAGVSSYALAAWLRKGQIESSKIDTETFNKSKLKRLIPVFRELTMKDPRDFYPEMVEHCKSCGIALVLVPHIPKTYVCGATQWINANKAVIQLSVRGARADIFWFTFFHEIAHIILHEKKEFHLQELDEKHCIEDEADVYARECLIPSTDYDIFVNSPGYSSRQSIISFANKLGIHPSIVVGRLAHDKKINYNQHSDLRPSFVIVKK